MVRTSILKNVIYRFILETLRVLIPIITVPYIYRLFNPEIMGNIEFSQSISGYALIFSGFGVYTYGLREISRVRDDKNKKEIYKDMKRVDRKELVRTIPCILFYNSDIDFVTGSQVRKRFFFMER